MKTRLHSLWRLLLIPPLLLVFSQACRSQIADYGKSFFNVTKGSTGGTVEPGDTLEIRASFVVRNTGFFDSCAFFDVVPTGTAYIPNTIRVLTNEGKIYKQFSDAQFGTLPYDEGWITGSNIRINLGYNQADQPARVFRRGRVRNTHKPSFYGSSCIMVASYRVRVTAVYGATINMGGGSFTYRLGTNPITTTVLPTNPVMIYRNYGMCSNTVGGNALGTEFNGTFGTGAARNRVASASVPPSYGYQIFDAGTPNDYTYGIPNNTSTRSNYTTLDTWAKPDASAPTHRVFQVWDIIGDHTGAASPILGNLAPDTAANPNAGYMLVINAAYRIDSAFQHTITGLCPNTYYEVSCWMRNICSKCGCDSNGKGASNTSGPIFYIPTALNDSSGVYPSIIFEIDGIDYYSTGELRYNGQWVKKGFTFLTGATQTSFTLKYKNNAPGGGGNDWALDDISVATCTPNLTFLPGTNPFLCANNVAELSGTVRSFFNNYTYYQWQRSTDGGSTWLDAGAPGGPATPAWNGSEWVYTVAYPPFIATMADSGHQYRLLVATTPANLSNPNCRFTDPSNTITLSIDPCEILSTSLISFSGRVMNKRAVLNWATTREKDPMRFEIEKSTNGINFALAGFLNGNNDSTLERNDYSFTDPELLEQLTWYRIRMTDLTTGEHKYSRIIQLTGSKPGIFIQSLINPFRDELKFDINVDFNGTIQTDLIDASGRLVIKKTYEVTKGISNINIAGTDNLPVGIYTLRVIAGSTVITRKMVKNE